MAKEYTYRGSVIFQVEPDRWMVGGHIFETLNLAQMEVDRGIDLVLALTKDTIPAGGQRSGREAHSLTAEGSTPSPATTFHYAGRRRLIASMGLRPALVLALPFFLHVHNILDEAEAHMRGGGAVDIDEIALLIGSRVRENLAVVYESTPEGR